MSVDRRAIRLGALAIVAVMAFSLLGVRLWFVYTVQADSLLAAVQSSNTRTVALVPERGRIFDADGRLLADNTRVLTVSVDREVIRDRPDRLELWRRLSPWLETAPEVLEERYQSVLYSQLLPVPLVEGVDEATAASILERSEDFPGVLVETGWRRVYPYAPLASHVVGYTGAITAEQLDGYLERGYTRGERVGQFGIELSMEDALHGTWGRRVYSIDAAGRPTGVIEEVPPIHGYDVQLSIDLDYQQYVEQALQTTLEARRGVLVPNLDVVRPDGTRDKEDPDMPDEVPLPAPAGSATLMNYETGAVLAMASYPTFDNRWLEADVSGGRFQRIFPATDDPDQSILVNRAVQGRYNLGSTFKPFTLTAALDTGLISATEIFTDTGEYELESVDEDRCDAGLVRCTYRNAICGGTGRPCSYGNVNAVDALAVSSDGYFYRIGEQIMVRNDDAPVLQQEVRKFGFGSETGIELPFEFAGTVPDAALKRSYAERGVITEAEGRDYYVGDNVQLAIGQGLLSATPLQLAAAYGAIANQGVLLVPKIVTKIWYAGVPHGETGFVDTTGGDLYEDRSAPNMANQIDFQPQVRDVLVRGLSRVVTPGGGLRSSITGNYHSATGENLFFDYPDEAIPIAGKTGTAQGFGNYSWNDSSAFAAFSLDTTQPFVMSAYLEKSGYGAQAAGPVVKCTFLALSGIAALDPVEVSDPLDLDSEIVAEPQRLSNTDCLATRTGAISGRD